MADKSKIGVDPLWWIDETGGAKRKKTARAGKGRAAKPDTGWVQTVVEIRPEYLTRLESAAEKKGVPLRKMLDGILAEVFAKKTKTTSGKSRR